jgi:hypothetical protein
MAATKSRFEDNPVINDINTNIKEILAEQRSQYKKLYDPETGLFTKIEKRVDHLEQWKKNTIDPERKKVKNWISRLIWAALLALAGGGTFFGLKLSTGP